MTKGCGCQRCCCACADGRLGVETQVLQGGAVSGLGCSQYGGECLGAGICNALVVLLQKWKLTTMLPHANPKGECPMNMQNIYCRQTRPYTTTKTLAASKNHSTGLASAIVGGARELQGGQARRQVQRQLLQGIVAASVG